MPVAAELFREVGVGDVLTGYSKSICEVCHCRHKNEGSDKQVHVD